MTGARRYIAQSIPSVIETAMAIQINLNDPLSCTFDSGCFDRINLFSKISDKNQQSQMISTI
jgi:hypothetical protein